MLALTKRDASRSEALPLEAADTGGAAQCRQIGILARVLRDSAPAVRSSSSAARIDGTTAVNRDVLHGRRFGRTLDQRRVPHRGKPEIARPLRKGTPGLGCAKDGPEAKKRSGDWRQRSPGMPSRRALRELLDGVEPANHIALGARLSRLMNRSSHAARRGQSTVAGETIAGGPGLNGLTMEVGCSLTPHCSGPDGHEGSDRLAPPSRIVIRATRTSPTRSSTGKPPVLIIRRAGHSCVRSSKSCPIDAAIELTRLSRRVRAGAGSACAPAENTKHDCANRARCASGASRDETNKGCVRVPSLMTGLLSKLQNWTE
jgi:hypothetical protein